MKSICIFLIVTLISMGSFSQNSDCDNIIYKNGEELSAKILEITTSFVKYKRCENLEGPTYSLELYKILIIKYKNGTKDVFNSTESNVYKEKSKSSFGFRLGLQSVAVGNSETIHQNSYKSRLGFLLGVTSFIPLGKKTGLMPGLIYSSKGASISHDSLPTTYLALNYIEIPLDVAFKIGTGGFALNIGPYIAFLTKATQRAKNFDLSGNEIDLNTYFIFPMYKGMDFGLNIGASYLIAGKFNLDLRYGLGLRDITTFERDFTNTQVNAALQFSFGIHF